LIQVGPNRKRMLARLSKMTPGDMPQFDPAMQMSLAGFNRAPEASVKLMIIISDGDPSPPSPATMQKYMNFKPEKIRITTVAVGSHGAAGTMGSTLQKIANDTGGKYYIVRNAKALPRIYQRETRQIARPLVYENEVLPVIEQNTSHEILRGIKGSLKPLTGFVLTTKKENPLVEVPIYSPKPDEKENATILATWTYGLGRTAVFTSDAGHRWAGEWAEKWPDYDKFFSQLVRWSMRPATDEGKYTVDTNLEDGKVQVVVTALDKDDEFLNFLKITGTAVSPDMKSFDINLEQTAPGRYVAEFDADQSGSYFLTLVPGAGKAPIRAGINVPYSAEFRDRETNVALLHTITDLTPTGGEPGEMIVGSLAPRKIDDLLEVDTFRHNLPKAVSSREMWPLLLLLAACVFFCDIAARRVMIGFEWLPPLWARLRNALLGRREEVKDERLQRLRSLKAEVGTQIDERRAATRFEPQPDEMPPDETLEAAMTAPDHREPKRPTDQPTAGPQPEEESYTERLLKAKQKVWKDKRKENP